MKSFTTLFQSEPIAETSTAAPQPSLDPRPRRIKQWLSQLPMADATGAARVLFYAVSHLMEAKHDAATLLAALETLRADVMRTADLLNERLYSLTPPLTGKSRATADLARALDQRMALAYRQVLRDFYEKVAITQNKHCALVVQRIIKHTSRELLSVYARYARTPEKLWRSLHECYVFAERYDLLRQPVGDAHHPNHEGSSVIDAYLQIAVTAGVNPYHLLHGEVHRLYQWLEPRCGSLELLPYLPQPTQHTALLPIDLKQDACPAAKTQRVNELHARWIDCRSLVKDIENALVGTDNASPTTQTTPLAQHFLKRIYIALSRHQNRRFSRSRCMQDVGVNIGLEAVHTPLLHTVGQGGWVQHYAGFSDTGAEPSIRTAGRALHPSNDPFAPHADAELTAETPSWLKVEESAGGCRMLWQYASSTRARVGDVVLFENANHQAKPMVGVVRWLQAVENYGLMMGLQLIAPYAEKVSLRAAERRCSGLLLPALKNLGQSETLLVAPESVAVPGWQLHVGKKVFRIKLQELVENTGIVAQYGFAQISPESEQQVETNETTAVPTSTQWRLVD